jgi:hypothetical protein
LFHGRHVCRRLVHCRQVARLFFHRLYPFVVEVQGTESSLLTAT